MNSFASIDGPKTVVFVSTKLPDLSRDNMYDYQEIGKAAAKAHVQMYVLQAHTLGAMDVDVNHPIVGGDGFSANGPTSAVGGGSAGLCRRHWRHVMQLSSSATSAFERINLESTAYYLLSFDARSSERDGKTHKISARPLEAQRDRARPAGVSHPQSGAAGPVEGADTHAAEGPAVVSRSTVARGRVFVSRRARQSQG
jgi:hypothetical protein